MVASVDRQVSTMRSSLIELKPVGSKSDLDCNSQSNSSMLHETSELIKDINVNVGLTSAQVAERQAIYGPNDVTIGPPSRKRGITGNNGRVMINSRLHKLATILAIIDVIWEWIGGTIMSKYFEQFKNPLILLLLASAAISLILGQIENCISISIAVILVVTVAFIQEWRTEKSLEALNRLAPPKCRALRNGVLCELLASELVPGDLVDLRTGDRVPADIKLVNGVDLEADESMLTGEAKACSKTFEDDDRLFMATLIRQGHGQGIVSSTGLSTRFGRMYSLMKETEEKRSPLQLHLDQLGQQLSIYSLGVIAIIAIIGLLQHQPILQIFTVAVSLAVAAIPEGLPIVATITLALGVLRLSRRNVIIKKLTAVEALGSVDTLCVDKTGTLTMNQLAVQSLFICKGNVSIDNLNDGLKEDALPKDFSALLTALKLSINCHKGDAGIWHGNAVDVALMNFINKFQSPTLCPSTNFKRIEEITFTSERKYMMVTVEGSSPFFNHNNELSSSNHELYTMAVTSSPLKVPVTNVNNPTRFLIAKGAPEVIIPMTLSSSSSSLSDQQQIDFGAKVEQMYNQGLRVIALASGTCNQNLKLLALIGMCDPPRPDISNTIRRINQCGVRCVMVTGDSKETALCLARQINWPLNTTTLDGCIAGNQLASNLDRIEELSIIYRATPEHKLRLVDALQKNGHVVAMTGDGVNDAPALKMSDVGIALGKSGTDVARAAAQIVLTDDRLASLIDGMEEGKGIFSNIRHFLKFQLSTSLAALTLIAISLDGGRLAVPPMNAMQILLINIIMDGPPAQSLGVEPIDPTVLTRPPRPKSTPILSKALLIRTAITAIHIVIGTFGVLKWERALYGNDSTRTFTAFVLFSIVNAITCRSNYRSVWQLGWFANKFLLVSSLTSIVILAAVLYLPALSAIFQTNPISFQEWIGLSILAISLLVVDEMIKLLIIRPALKRKRGRNTNTNNNNNSNKGMETMPLKSNQVCNV